MKNTVFRGEIRIIPAKRVVSSLGKLPFPLGKFFPPSIQNSIWRYKNLYICPRQGKTHYNSKFKIHKIMATKKAKKKSTRKPSAAFMKPLTPSAALAEVVGSKPLPRTEVVKKMWVYIKKNKLQDSKNRRMINADAKLKPIFSGKSQVSMFDMAKHLAKNLK
jgi:chromatin remodeling complex protein RSC6